MIVNECIIAANARSLTPIAGTLLLRLSLCYTASPWDHWKTIANLPKDLRGLCLHLLFYNNESLNRLEFKYLPTSLRSICIHVGANSLCSRVFFTNFKAYFPKLERLALVENRNYRGTGLWDGEAILHYLQGAKHLIELRLYSDGFHDIELKDFYDRALETIEKREEKLPLEIYHRGETIVSNNSSLKLLNAHGSDSEFCGHLETKAGSWE